MVLEFSYYKDISFVSIGSGAKTKSYKSVSFAEEL